MAGRASRQKGQRGERELCELLRAYGWPEAGRNHEQTERGGADTVRGPEGYVFEAKRGKERISLAPAMRQAQNAAESHETPVVAHRVDRQPWYATLPLEALLELLKTQEEATWLERLAKEVSDG